MVTKIPPRPGGCLSRGSRRLRQRNGASPATGIVAATLMLTAASAPVAAAPFPAEIELSELASGDGSAGFVLNGAIAGDRSGLAVSALGDLNNDGVNDLIVGAEFASPDGEDDAGESYVLFGRDAAQTGPFAAQMELSGLAGGDGSTGFVLVGAGAFDQSGTAMSDAGDVNGDDVDDLIVCAQVGLNFSGRCDVVFGRDTAQSGTFPAEFALSSLASGDGSTGFSLLTDPSNSDRLGLSVAGAVDLNGDGFGDIVMGAPNTVSGIHAVGAAYVVFGQDTADAGNFPALFELLTLANGDGSAGFAVGGAGPFSSLGSAVGAAGDLNGDGIDDVALGAPSGLPTDSGVSYVVFGRDTNQAGNFPADFDLSALATGDGSTGFTLLGVDAGDRSGEWVGFAGDVNGDGIDDLVIGAGSADPGGRADAGETYIVFGRDTAVSGNFPASFALSTLAAGDGSTGFVLNGVDAGDRAGRRVSAAGDVNGDGIDDLIVGAGDADPGGSSSAGESYVVFGRDTALTGNFPALFELSSLAAGNGTDGVVLYGSDADDRAATVSGGGDVNGDGLSDLLVGADGGDPADRVDAGETYVVLGRADADGDGIDDSNDNCLTFQNADQRDTNEDGFGNACDADLNGDCTVNFADLALFKAGFFPVNGPDADFDGDGNVDFGDLARMKETFFNTGTPGPGPSGVPNSCAP